MSLILTDDQVWAVVKAYHLSSEITRLTFNDEIDVDFHHDGEIVVIGGKPSRDEPAPVETYGHAEDLKETYGV